VTTFVAGMFGVYSSAKRDRCLSVPFTVFSRRKIQEDADEILMVLRAPLCLSKSVFQLSRCLSDPLLLLPPLGRPG
jgi:hypothetical protein